ncbi:Uncharacterised protein [Vibrio cholerae]|uniref:Uncharacterized protein n=1 Tax=Vibrio cholerae TaxID=666 RepID=A0A655T970_VIBCL|nr:Uncharacterised protein [Vibrio cholerae]CSC51290.1 Uncharacterised protein [Vibrio cholerae]
MQPLTDVSLFDKRTHFIPHFLMILIEPMEFRLSQQIHLNRTFIDRATSQ